MINEEVLKIAASQVGVREIKNTNTGEEVNTYLKSVGLKPGYPWCMAFVYWVYQLASVNLKIKNPLIKTGGVLFQWENTKAENKVSPGDASRDNSLVPPGSIFIIDHGGGKGHTGLVERIYGGFIETIEGNSNTTGSREGTSVVRLQRKISTLKGFIVQQKQ